MPAPASPIIVALDFADARSAVNFARQLDPAQVRVKVGKELFVSAGPAVVEQLQQLGFELFLDLKFHDIPNTVAKACLATAQLDIWMINIHASGGAIMMQQVMQTLQNLPKRPLVTAVTVLTSMNDETLRLLNVSIPIQEQVTHLAQLAQQSGVDGVVCSAQEARRLRQQCGDNFLLVTPGIRLTSNNDDDQQRIMTPKKALAAGSDYLVIGRPITQSSHPTQVIDDIIDSLKTP